MAVTREQVLQIAALARLELSDSELERLTGQLNRILEHVDELAELGSLEGVPEAGAADRTAPLRDEESKPDALVVPPSELAPDWREGFFVVPRLAALDAGES
ncbi:MAG TPA: Asp-tRNA(Asn)/Glu-tRNA(Gln) amidotransferase subunit GatC [Longimicrobiales bacterium]|nr:Asp-tRNA(Asn)/Glu-tRNA(Gln) amidotransferase subunit GatC [Longimicrobiales bacterium]